MEQDVLLAQLFEAIGTTSKYFVEIKSNLLGSRYNAAFFYLSCGWDGTVVAPGPEHVHVPRANVKQIDEEAALDVLERGGMGKRNAVPKDLDLLTIDAGANDLRMLEALLKGTTNTTHAGRNYARKYNPRVVVIRTSGGL